MAWQFHRADLNQGVVQVFRREQSPVATATYRLYGLDASARYTLTDLDSRQTCTMSGEELMARGREFHIASPARRCRDHLPQVAAVGRNGATLVPAYCWRLEAAGWRRCGRFCLGCGPAE